MVVAQTPLFFSVATWGWRLPFIVVSIFSKIATSLFFVLVRPDAEELTQTPADTAKGSHVSRELTTGEPGPRMSYLPVRVDLNWDKGRSMYHCASLTGRFQEQLQTYVAVFASSRHTF